MYEANINGGYEQSPLVSIWCITYNQKDYIRDAIEGFLLQQTSFTYDIIIHDDASTDGTQEILREYENRYPNLIKVIYEKENIYLRQDRREIINDIKRKKLRGRYVAMCEGDDYWIDPFKLQKQVEYLESNTDCAMVVHNHIVLDCETEEKITKNRCGLTGIVPTENVILSDKPIFQTASYVMKKEICIIEGVFAKSCIGDYAVRLHALSQGYIFYMDDVMSIYRYNSQGSWTRKNHDQGKAQIMRYIQGIIFMQEYERFTNGKYTKYIKKKIRHLVYAIYDIARENVDYFNQNIKTLLNELDSVYHDCLYSVEDNFKNGAEIEKQLPDLLEYCKDKRIWIWGVGTVSDRFSMALENEGIVIEGYIVSKKDIQSTFHGKKIWEIDDFSYDKNEMGIIVATTSWWSYEITEKMYEYGIEDYYCAYEKGI